MAISSLTSSSFQSTQTLQALAARNSSDQAPRTGGGALEVAAKALGLSTDDVVAGLKEGKSLADLAAEQGVSRNDLAAALKAGAPKGLAESGDADQVINKIIDQVGLPKGGPRGPQGPPPPPPNRSSTDGTTTGVYGTSLTGDQQSMLDTLSQLLDTDSQTLLDKLKSGTSLTDLIKSKNLTQDTLASVLQDGLLFDARA